MAKPIQIAVGTFDNSEIETEEAHVYVLCDDGKIYCRKYKRDYTLPPMLIEWSVLDGPWQAKESV